MEKPLLDNQPESPDDKIDSHEHQPSERAFDSIRTLFEGWADKDEDKTPEASAQDASTPPRFPKLFDMSLRGASKEAAQPLASSAELNQPSSLHEHQQELERKIGQQSQTLESQPTIEISSGNASNEIGARLVLEQAANAAEQNIPIESYYERRHEAKDEQTTAHPYVGQTQTEGMGDTPQANTTLSAPSLEELEKKAMQATTQPPTHTRVPRLYKNAALSGLIAAAVIVAVTLMVLVISH